VIENLFDGFLCQQDLRAWFQLGITLNPIRVQGQVVDLRQASQPHLPSGLSERLAQQQGYDKCGIAP
jgi:hypothetical protein